MRNLVLAFVTLIALTGTARAYDLPDTHWGLGPCMHKVELGMPVAQLYLVCGLPASKNAYDAGHTEQWRYDSQKDTHFAYIYLADGAVTSWQEFGK